MAGKNFQTVRRGEIWIVNLDPTVGSEIRKTRPCLIVTPDILNGKLKTVQVAPISSKKRGWLFRPLLNTGQVDGEVLLDQIRCIDKKRLLKSVAILPENDLKQVLSILREMFAE